MKWKSLGHLVEDAGHQFGDKPLFIFEDKPLSFAEANRQANKVANALRSLGVVKGERVAVMLPNGIEFPITWFALAKLGAIIVPVNINYQDHDLTYALQDSQAGFFLVHERFQGQWARVQAGLPLVKKMLLVTEANETSAWRRLVEDSTDVFELSEVTMDDLVNIQYTSGTTGFPKGCMLTQKYWLQLGQLAADYFALTPDECNLTAQPFYYMDPQWNTVACLIGGAPLVILSRFSPSHFWQEVMKHHVTVLYLLGTMPFFLLQMPEDPELERGHHLRVVLCSGIMPKFHAEFERRWGVPWREAFGMTETGVDLIIPREDEASVGSGAMGKPIPTKEARVVDLTGKDVPDGEIGELILRGEPMMLGYWNKPEATADIIRDGWLHTGDWVSRGEKGYFYWQGRIKDTIRRAGENIAAAEVESVLMAHPAVKVAAVIPVPDELRGEEVKAYIVLKAEHTPEDTPPEAILDYARQQLAYFKVPRFIEYADDLPRTPSERVEKHKLTKMKPDLRVGSYDAVAKAWK
ncbi:MAG: AMP-binding protein [Chloroflexi bacterium]|nr:AMP-binding protein [Chloroflexota bacterium]MBP8056035.1 AMP-binding protein [Chloroflexota bacterium]